MPKVTTPSKTSKNELNTEVLYQGPLRKIEFRYSGPPGVFLAAAIISGIVAGGVIIVKIVAGF